MMESYEEEAPVIMMYQKGLGSSKPCSKRVRSQEDWKMEGKRERERSREGGYLYLGGTRSARAIS